MSLDEILNKVLNADPNISDLQPTLSPSSPTLTSKTFEQRWSPRTGSRDFSTASRLFLGLWPSQKRAEKVSAL